MRISDWSSDVCSSDLPVQGEAARAAVLGSLASVNRVVIFGDDTPLAVIAALRPDVLVKGADYSLEQVVGAELVQGYGGRVVLAELAPGHSTTATIPPPSRTWGFSQCLHRPPPAPCGPWNARSRTPPNYAP